MVHGNPLFPGPLPSDHCFCGGNGTGAGGRFRSVLFLPRSGEQVCDFSGIAAHHSLGFDSSLGYP
eukprot:9998284-Heterocapsa_arctica.AAC.1